MKTFLILLSSTLFFLTAASAQNYSVTIQQDDPLLARDRFVTLDIVGADLDFNFLSSNVYIGSSVFWPVNKKLIAEGSLKIPVITLSGKGLGFTVEPGLFFAFSSKKKTDEVPLLISGTLYASETETGDYIDTYNLANVNGTYLKRFGVRAGLYVRKAGYENDAAIPIESNATLGGIYLGLENISQVFVKALLNGNELTDSERIGAGLSRFYLDALFLPIQSITDERLQDQTDSDNPFGFRLGYQLNRRPFKADSWITKIVYGGEVGVRPLTGFYVALNMGWVVFDR